MASWAAPTPIKQRLVVSDDVLTYVCASGSLANSVGTQVWVGSSLSGLAVHAKAPSRCDDSEADEGVDRNACRRVGAVSMICLPLPYRQGVAGVLKLSSRQRFAFDDDDMRVLAGLARFIGEAIGGWGELARSAKAVLRDFPDGEPGSRQANGEPDSFGGSAAGEPMPKVSAFLSNVLDPSEQVDAGVRHRIEQTIREVGIAIVLQPIVSLKTGFVAGYEALSQPARKSSPKASKPRRSSTPSTAWASTMGKDFCWVGRILIHKPPSSCQLGAPGL